MGSALEKRDAPLLGTERPDGLDMVAHEVDRRKDAKRSRPWGIIQIPQFSCLYLRYSLRGSTTGSWSPLRGRYSAVPVDVSVNAH